MKAPTATLKALFSQENDSSFSHYLGIQTDSSKNASDLFINLNTGEHMLAALAFNSSSEPIVILDAETARNKASLLVLSKDLDLDVVLLEDHKTLDKTNAAASISIPIHPSYFQEGMRSEEEYKAEAFPICLFPSEWIGLMIDEDSDSLSLSTLQVNLMAKLSNISAIQNQIAESSIIKNLCNFLSLGEDDDNTAQLEALKLGAFAEKLGNSRPVKKMKEKLEDIKSELEKIPSTETMENSIRDSTSQLRQEALPSTPPPLSAEEKAKAEAEAKAKAAAIAKANATAEANARSEERARKRKERDEQDNLKDDDSDSDSDSNDEEGDSDSDPVYLGNRKTTPSKFDSLNQLYNIDKISASDKAISRNLKRQKLIGENGVIQGFMQSTRIDDHLDFCTLVSGKATTELNDIFTEILTCNKDKRDVARATKKAVKKIAHHLSIEGKFDHVCNKTAEYILSGEPFVEKDVIKEEDLTGLSFMSIPIPTRDSISKNGAKYYIPKTTEDLIFQLKVFLGHLIILFAKKPERELKGGTRDKNSSICALARNLLQQVIDAKPKISATFEKNSGSNFDVARRIHNKFIQITFSHITQEKSILGAKLTCKVIEDISESDYRPPQKPFKPNGGDNRSHRSNVRSNRRNDGESQDKGYFHFSKYVLKKAYSNKDKIPKSNSKEVCLKCAKMGTKKCRNSDNNSLFHGPFGQNHEADMKAFGDAIGERIVKNQRRDGLLSTTQPFLVHQILGDSTMEGKDPPQAENIEISSSSLPQSSKVEEKDDDMEMDEESSPTPSQDPGKGNEQESTYKREKPSRLVSLLKAAYEFVTPTPAKSKFHFENDVKAAARNSNIFLGNNNDIIKTIQEQEDSDLLPGCELRDKSVVNPLFDLHLDGEKLKKMNETGIEYKFKKKYTQQEMDSDRNHGITMGNNKSTIGKKDFIDKSYDKEVRRHWMIPVLTASLASMAAVVCIKIGIATQHTISAIGEIIEKFRVTHDASQALPSGNSVNLLCDDDEMEEVRFGMAMKRFLIQLVQQRLAFPNLPILIGKFDLDSAYRRLFVKLSYALLCTTIIGPIAYLLLRLPFGSSPAASEFSLFSEFICDLAQDLLLDQTWDHNSFFPTITEGVSIADFNFPSSSPALARPILISAPLLSAYFDCYIDDFIVLVVFTSMEAITRAFLAVPLVLECIFRPVATDEPGERATILQKAKLLAEGTLRIKQKVLGWIIDTHSLSILLPKEKRDTILAMIDKFMEMHEKETIIDFEDRKELESLIGKLNNISIMFPNTGTLLNRLRYRHKVAGWPKPKKERRNTNKILDKFDYEDLKLWRRITSTMTTVGRHVNTVIPSIPELITVSDASLFGIAGYFILHDCIILWRFELPDPLKGRLTLNLLEYLAQNINIGFATEFIHQFHPHHFTNQSIGDSATAISWQRRTKFNPHTTPAHDFATRVGASHLLSNNISNLESHLHGEDNIISDSASRDFHCPIDLLCQGYLSKPSTKGMIPPKIITFTPNKEKISSLLQSTADLLKGEKLQLSKPNRSKFCAGLVGLSSFVESDSAITHTSSIEEAYTAWSEKTSSLRLLTPGEWVSSTERHLVPVASIKLKGFDKPSELYARGSRMKDTLIHQDMPTED